MTYDEVLGLFDGVDQRGPNNAMARCPHHPDGSASLSISQGRDGVLLHCHAGCPTNDVLADVGLKPADLFDKPKAVNGNGRQARREVARYPYVDEQGQLLFEKIRFEPKDFRVRRPDGRGGWTYKIGDTRRVLYRLPELIAAIRDNQTIWVAEGEKDCDALAKAGQTATTNFDGAGKWKPDYTQHFAGAQLVQIVADNDEVGRHHALTVRDEMTKHGIPCTVWLPAAGHKDIADHLGAGLTLDELVPLQVYQDGAYDHDNLDAAPNVGDVHDDLAGLVKPYTDDANALRFTRTHGHVVRYVPEWGIWLRWDGTRWERDKKRTVVELARGVARAIYHDAMRAGADDHKEAMRWASQTCNTPRLHAMLDLARSAEGIPVLAEELDADNWLLNCTNGTLDLRTGTLRPHDQKDLITKRVGCAYNIDADAPRFEAFLEQILPDPEVRLFVQAYAGYCLTGLTTEQILVFAYGVGANGKTTLIQALLGVLGDYAKQAEPDLLLDRDNAHPTGVADLQGARLVVSSEIEDGRSLAEASVKQLTGGDRIKARYMRQDFFEFEPTHKIFVATNHKPRVRGTDHAIWRRIRLVPFSQVIDKADQDPGLPDALREEASGILTWMVAGCQLWQTHGLPIPAVIAAATDAYRAEEDRVGAFLEECCETDPNAYEAAGDLYAAYTAWVEANGERPLSQKRFGSRLTERQLDRQRLGAAQRWHWIGIRLSPAHSPLRQTQQTL